MYEIMANLHLELDSLFSEDDGSFVRIEYHKLLRRLGDYARETFMRFGNAIASDASLHPFPGGRIHHLTKSSAPGRSANFNFTESNPSLSKFSGNNNSNVSDKHVKYATDDLEELLLDLFVGSPRSLRNSRRRDLGDHDLMCQLAARRKPSYSRSSMDAIDDVESGEDDEVDD
ncbi:hypothetical protein GH714_040915 [Hevea brasiliensis]|uniref:Exocyst subunit Exo70 family protein n=1 Tax=Hevea brasiliensis TaxID=3981 RepID=A0A6A6MGN3_HEVBR|nr:hypothetical protein GH714_040915 [Hevea brasiliensis]